MITSELHLIKTIITRSTLSCCLVCSCFLRFRRRWNRGGKMQIVIRQPIVKKTEQKPLSVGGGAAVWMPTFLLAFRRSAFCRAFSSSLKSSSPFIAFWANIKSGKIKVQHCITNGTVALPVLSCQDDTIYLPVAKWHCDLGQSLHHHSSSAPLAAGWQDLWKKLGKKTSYV